jgi:hypothetical protein
MKMADLKQHLADLTKVLDSAGAGKGVIADLRSIVEGLAPFNEFALKDFAGFLVRAEAYSRGEVLVKGIKAPPKSPSKSGAKGTQGDPATLAQEAKRVYEEAAYPTVTVEIIDSLAGRIGNLSKDGMLTVAAALDLRFSKAATKGSVVDAIRKRILDRKGVFQRTGLLGRSSAPSSSHSGNQAAASPDTVPAGTVY